MLSKTKTVHKFWNALKEYKKKTVTYTPTLGPEKHIKIKSLLEYILIQCSFSKLFIADLIIISYYTRSGNGLLIVHILWSSSSSD